MLLDGIRSELQHRWLHSRSELPSGSYKLAAGTEAIVS